MNKVSLEETLVEKYLVEKLQEKGWKFVPADELERESYEEPLLLTNLREAIKRINKNVPLIPQDITKVVDELRHKIPGVETFKKILNYLKEGVPIKLETTKDLRFIKLIDYENIDNNEFIVSRQVYFRGLDLIRADIILFVNGIPLVVIECKDPTDPYLTWEDAYNQIKKYEKLVEDLFKYVQFSIAAVENVRYFPNVPWLDKVEVSTWKEENKNEMDSIVEMLSKEKLLDILKNFIFIREEKQRVSKVLPRYMQYKAANEIYKRVVNTLRGVGRKKKGVVWHWQGSGKTLTMIFAAYKLYNEKLLENPTIFFVLDRKELQKQLSDEIAALDLGIKPDIIEGIDELKRILSYDNGRGKKGWIITLIHKFRYEELKLLKETLEKEFQGKESVLTRENIIVFVDEAHRTQYGTLAATMRSILKNAFFFAFTGTPITGKRDTFAAFGDYVDCYFMDDSIKDGYTLPIRYQPRLDKVHVEKELMREFLRQKEEEEIPEVIRGKLSKKLMDIKIFLEDDKRIKEIANDIVEHFMKNVDGKFKAFVVAVSRKACIKYKNAIDEVLRNRGIDPTNFAEVVITFEREDEPEIANYEIELRKRFNGKETEDILKEIQDNFKYSEYPKIIIVTSMLLTGFDAPILQTMYLDKPMKGHTLLQAIARVNRPLKERGKVFGLIIDYVGIFKELNKAITFYSKLKSKKSKVEGISHVNTTLFDLEIEIDEMKKIIGDVEIKFDRDHLYQILTKISTENNEAKFEMKYKKIRELYESLGFSDKSIEARLEYKEYIKFLTAIYVLLKRTRGEKEEEEVEKWFRIIRDEILNDIQIKDIIKSFPEAKLDEKYIEEVEKNYKTIDSRVWNRLGIVRNVIQEKPNNPVYNSLRERVERLVIKWKERPKEIEKIYKELKDVFRDFIIIESQKSKYNLSDEEFSIFSTLKNRIKLENEEELAKKVKEFYTSLNLPKDWKVKKTLRSEVMQKIKIFLIKNFPQIKGDERDEVAKEIIQAL
jgi:type I restriction enzyme R subunit